MKPRLARTFLKTFLDNTKPLGTLYGAILGLSSVGGGEPIRILILPNIKTFEDFIRDDIVNDGPRKAEAEMCLKAIVNSLKKLREEDGKGGVDLDEKMVVVNGDAAAAATATTTTSMDMDDDGVRQKLMDRIGELAANQVLELHDEKFVRMLATSPQIVP